MRRTAKTDAWYRQKTLKRLLRMVINSLAPIIEVRASATDCSSGRDDSQVGSLLVQQHPYRLSRMSVPQLALVPGWRQPLGRRAAISTWVCR